MVHNTCNWLSIVLVMVVLSMNNLFSMDTAHQNPGDTHQDEIGSSVVARIKQELKEPFLTLLASSEYVNKTEFLNRIKAAQEALSHFTASVQDQLAVYHEMPQQPVQNLPTIQVSTPVQMTMPSPQSTIESQENELPAMAIPVIPQQASAEEKTVDVSPQLTLPELPVAQTQEPVSIPGSLEPLATQPPQQQSPFQTPPAVISTTEVPTPVQPLEAPQALPQQLPETEEHPVSTGSTAVNAATATMPAEVGVTTLPQMPS